MWLIVPQSRHGSITVGDDDKAGSCVQATPELLVSSVRGVAAFSLNILDETADGNFHSEKSMQTVLVLLEIMKWRT